MNVFQYPALKDNYNWIISCNKTRYCAGIDIYDTSIFFDYIKKNDLIPIAILNTHHHHDHTGGNNAIFEKYKQIKFYGSDYDLQHKRIECQTDGLDEGDKVNIGDITLNVLNIPGHTLGHICYYNKSAAFVGDTLFASGCGRLFEGTPKQMYHSLEKIIDNIDHSTPIYCGHEYTESNLNFSSSLNSKYFADYRQRIKLERQDNKMTVPTNIKTELKYNPFIMVRDKYLKKEILNLDKYSSEEAFSILRNKKDNF
ncbi:MAG: hydroxyacylglutathione hydrolase [Candidatus Sericytochromatia bacterium]|nr:hydroxyacylglutathione hydrolase [Candidatus Sericytochromatia bacterium]